MTRMDRCEPFYLQHGFTIYRNIRSSNLDFALTAAKHLNCPKSLRAFFHHGFDDILPLIQLRKFLSIFKCCCVINPVRALYMREKKYLSLTQVAEILSEIRSADCCEFLIECKLPPCDARDYE